MKTEAMILTEMVEKTRELTQWYLSKLKDTDPYKTFEFEGKKFNPVIWEIGHLVNSENFLLLHLTNGKAERLEWAKLFGLGVSLPKKDDYPPYDELWKAFKDVHNKVIAHLSVLTEEQLNAPSKMEFAGITTVRGAIQHGIRHEGTHIGHLGWLCKLHGVKTI